MVSKRDVQHLIKAEHQAIIAGVSKVQADNNAVWDTAYDQLVARLDHLSAHIEELEQTVRNQAVVLADLQRNKDPRISKDVSWMQEQILAWDDRLTALEAFCGIHEADRGD